MEGDSPETGAALLTAPDDPVSRPCLVRAATAGATTATASAVSKRQSSGSLQFEDGDEEAVEAASGPSSIVTEEAEEVPKRSRFLALEARDVLLSMTTVECDDSIESESTTSEERATASSIQSSRPNFIFRPIVNLCISPSSPSKGGDPGVKISAVSRPLFCTS